MTLRKRKLVDTKCLDLAEHFLKDEPTLNTTARCYDLAAYVQQAVEDWFEYECEYGGQK